MLNALAKIDIVNVPYRGAALVLNDVLAGQIPMGWAAPTAVMPHVATGKVKILGVASAQAPAVVAAGADRLPRTACRASISTSGSASRRPPRRRPMWSRGCPRRSPRSVAQPDVQGADRRRSA